jgi:hypothetical protein
MAEGEKKGSLTHSQVGIIMSAVAGRAPSHVLVGRGLEALVKGDCQRHQVSPQQMAPALLSAFDYFHVV